MGASGPLALWGRSRERHELDSALGAVLGGQSAVLVLRGEPGIGKTALLEYAASHAGDFRVVRVAGVESELELPFAALHQLCAALLGDLESLPEPQARALKVAFGMAAGNAPDRFLVGLAVLGLLAEAASPRPLLCLVDDAHWIDAASRQILGVVGRRLQAESVLLVLAVREAGDERLFPGLPELTVEGLTDGDAQALLAAAAAGPLDPRVAGRLIAETGGNPLALLELVKDTSEAELAGGFVTTPKSTLSGPLEDHYVSLVRALPEPAQRLMLLAAADPTGDATLLWRAAQLLGLGHETVHEAHAQQLLDIGPTVRFRHPLVRSAAYAAGSAQDRRSVHLALADVTDPDTDPDRRVWHLAAGASGPDDDIASALEQAAERAQARAGLPAATAFLRRAAELTADPRRRTERALAAAHASLHAGTFDVALGLLAEADADADEDLQRARVEQLRGEVARAVNSGSQAPVLLAQASRRLESLDVTLARETYLDAWGAALVAGRLAAPGGDLVEVSAAARSAPPAARTPHGPQPPDLLLEGLTTVVLDGQGAATATLRQAVAAFLDDQPTPDQWLHWGVLAANAALALWDFDCWDAVSARHVTLARESGALASLAAALNVHRGVAVWAGDLERASSLGVEERVVKEVTGTQRASYGDLLLVAHQGPAERASSFIAASVREATARGEGLGVQIGDRATAILSIGLGHYADALTAAQHAAEGNLGPFTAQALPDLVEAAARCGEPQLAAAALNRLQLATAVDGSDWAAGVEARSRALLAEGRTADSGYAEAVDRLGNTRLRLELARTRLLYGEWLRREGRRVDARKQLRPAHDTFAMVGAEAFADRARRELLATGEKVRKREVDTVNQLTPQEEHIARLARDGHTNPEIAAELFISARTVEWHLRKVFAKLDVTNRRGLKEALPDRRQPHLAGQRG
jgi:DNA-binding CsgD family transcriptional regulator